MYVDLRELNDLGDRMMQGLPYNQGGAVTGASNYDTFSSPDVTQDPNKFGTLDDKSKITADQNQSIEKISPLAPLGSKAPEDFVKDVDKIKTQVTPDEVITGIDYEMKRMVLKDKQVAKQTVVNNLKKDPKYYSSLHMLDLDLDKPKKPPESPKEPVAENIDWRTPQEKEIANIMKDMFNKKMNRLKSGKWN